MLSRQSRRHTYASPVGILSGDGANLVLGVVSDIHVDCGRGDFRKFGDTAQFEKTLGIATLTSYTSVHSTDRMAEIRLES